MKKLVIIVSLVILIVVLILGFIYLSKPDKLTEKQRQEAIDMVAGGKANLEGPQVKSGNTSYQGKKAQFSYPAAAVIYEYRNPNSAEKDKNSENFSFDIKSPRLILNYNATATKETKIEDISAVKLRNDPASGYTKSEEKVDGVSGVSYKKDRSGEYMAEKTTFLINDGFLYTISITGSSPEDIEKLSTQILNSFRFN